MDFRLNRRYHPRIIEGLKVLDIDKQNYSYYHKDFINPYRTYCQFIEQFTEITLIEIVPSIKSLFEKHLQPLSDREFTLLVIYMSDGPHALADHIRRSYKSSWPNQISQQDPEFWQNFVSDALEHHI